MRFILWGLLFVSSLSHAEYSALDLCPSEIDSQGLYECSKKKNLDADLQLNAAYRELNESIAYDYKADPELGEKLKLHIKKSQRAWIIVRDENCAIESFLATPGTQAFETTMGFCLARESLMRTEYIKNLKF